MTLSPPTSVSSLHSTNDNHSNNTHGTNHNSSSMQLIHRSKSPRNTTAHIAMLLNSSSSSNSTATAAPGTHLTVPKNPGSSKVKFFIDSHHHRHHRRQAEGDPPHDEQYDDNNNGDDDDVGGAGDENENAEHGRDSTSSVSSRDPDTHIKKGRPRFHKATSSPTLSKLFSHLKHAPLHHRPLSLSTTASSSSSLTNLDYDTNYNTGNVATPQYKINRAPSPRPSIPNTSNPTTNNHTNGTTTTNTINHNNNASNNSGTTVNVRGRGPLSRHSSLTQLPSASQSSSSNLDMDVSLDVIKAFCPRLSSWRGCSTESVFHPRVSSLVLDRMHREEALTESMDFQEVIGMNRHHPLSKSQPAHMNQMESLDDDDDESDDGGDGDCDGDENKVDLSDNELSIGHVKRAKSYHASHHHSSSHLHNSSNRASSGDLHAKSKSDSVIAKIGVLSLESRWEILGHIYESYLREQEKSEQLEELVHRILNHPSVVISMDRWWHLLINGKKNLDRNVFTYALLKIMSVLVPNSNAIWTPAGKVAIAQEDTRRLLRNSRVVERRHLEDMLMQLCDNWVNMRKKGKPGALCIEKSTDVRRADSIAMEYHWFLDDLFEKTFSKSKLMRRSQSHYIDRSMSPRTHTAPLLKMQSENSTLVGKWRNGRDMPV